MVIMCLKKYFYKNRIVFAYNKEHARRKLERKFKIKVPYSELKNVMLLWCRYWKRRLK